MELSPGVARACVSESGIGTALLKPIQPRKNTSSGNADKTTPLNPTPPSESRLSNNTSHITRDYGAGDESENKDRIFSIQATPQLPKRTDDDLIKISCRPLPSVAQVVRCSNLARPGKTEIASFSSFGQVMNLGMTRKMIQLNGPPEPRDTTWPANEIFLNPIVESEKRNKRWFTAYRSLEEAIHRICDCVKETRDLGGIALIIRLGMVPQSDKSMIIAVSGHTPSEATIAAREILEQLSRVELQKITP